jgi:hypothetical protein
LSEVRPDPSSLVGEAARLVDAVNKEKKVLRMYGAAAIYYHCPNNVGLFSLMGRRPGDMDFAAYQKDSSKIAQIVERQGYDEDLTVTAFGGGRLVFNRRTDGMHCDIFLGKLEMSHVLSFDGRLELDYPTAPLADLLLSKLQIFKLNEKDAVDTIILLREHQLGKGGKETVDLDYVSSLCSKDWGLWRTVTGNVQKVAALLPEYKALPEAERADAAAKLEQLSKALESAPKSMSWKLRARVGDSRKWYNDVEDLYR